jgi:hypothetical protein
MKTWILCFMALVFYTECHAQYRNVYSAKLNWSQKWDYIGKDDYTAVRNCLTLDDSDNIYVAGRCRRDTLGNDGWMISKYSPAGDSLWHYVDNFAPNHTDYSCKSNAILWDSAKHRLFSTGTYASDVGGYGRVEYYQVRMTTTAGKSLGEYIFPDIFSTYVHFAEGYNTCIDREGNAYFTGYTFQDANKHNVMTSSRINPVAGGRRSVLFKALDSSIYATGQYIAADNLLNAYICGVIIDQKGATENMSIVSVKYDSIGNIKWMKRYQNDDSLELTSATGIAVDKNGNMFVSGNIPVQKTGSQEGIILKYDTNGKLIWQKKLSALLPGTRFAACNGIILDKKGSLFAAGYNETSTGTYAMLVMIDSVGNITWHDTLTDPYNSRNNTQAVALTPDDSGNVYVTGTRSDNLTFRQIYTARYSPDGTRQWYTRYPDSTGGTNDPASIGLDKKGNVIVAGMHDGDTLTGEDILILKYSQQMTRVKTGKKPEVLQTPNIIIYPNPVIDRLYCRINLENRAQVIIRIFDISGKEVYSSRDLNIKRGVTVQDFDLSSLASGFYYYSASLLTQNQTRVFNGKLVKVK